MRWAVATPHDKLHASTHMPQQQSELQRNMDNECKSSRIALYPSRLSREVGVAALVLAVALGLVRQGLDDAIVRGVLGEVGEPQQSGALGREDGRNPRKRIPEGG